MSEVTRRQALRMLAQAGAAAATAACASDDRTTKETKMASTTRGSEGPAGPGATPARPSPILRSAPLGFQWQTRDPFLFCVHHDDHYPAGNERLGLDPSALTGRSIGQDFEPKDGFRMYHGHVVPGFPRHPHRGFETVTIVRRGLLDHADSMGAGARYGGGDVQWLTAGAGIQHAEMFPLVQRDGDNPVELFQIWVNLPASDKFVAPHFSMLWRESIPSVTTLDAADRATTVTLIAGAYGGQRAPAPPPSSWAARADTDVAIWTLKMAPGARFDMPAAQPGSHRTLYVFAGAGLQLDGHALSAHQQADLRADVAVAIENGDQEAEMLVLQGRPIAEPVAHHGPFVMNTRAELQQAYADYQRTQFGGWPWDAADPVHGQVGRFARHADGRVEEPG